MNVLNDVTQNTMLWSSLLLYYYCCVAGVLGVDFLQLTYDGTIQSKLRSLTLFSLCVDARG